MIATELYYEIEGRDYVTFRENAGFNVDIGDTYYTLTGTLRMDWRWCYDETVGRYRELKSIDFSDDTTLHTVVCGEQVPNNFQTKRLREYLID